VEGKTFMRFSWGVCVRIWATGKKAFGKRAERLSVGLGEKETGGKRKVQDTLSATPPQDERPYLSGDSRGRKEGTARCWPNFGVVETGCVLNGNENLTVNSSHP